MPLETKTILKEKLLDKISSSLDELLQTFYEIMPASYFETTDQTEILQHLSAILSAKISGNQERIILENQDSNRQTYIHFGSFPGLLGKILDQIPADKRIEQARVYTAKNNELIIDVFDYVRDCSAQNDGSYALREALLAELKNASEDQCLIQNKLIVEQFIGQVNINYLTRYSLTNIISHSLLANAVRSTLNSAIAINRVDDEKTVFDIALAVGQVDSTSIFKRIAQYISICEGDIREAFVENFAVDTPDQRALVVLQVQLENYTESEFAVLVEDLKRLSYLDKSVLNIAFTHKPWSLLDSEILVAVCHMADQIFVGRGKISYSRESIIKDVLEYSELALAICEIVRVRFSLDRFGEFSGLYNTLAAQVKDQVAETTHAQIFTLLLEISQNLLKSNLYSSKRYSLAFRLNPELMLSDTRNHLTYGIFYIAGKAFDGFHVRFEDIARGGVRIVTPYGQEQYAIEVHRLFDEAYQLANAQQLKNKDIPEGGSKGVILVKPSANRLRCGKSYVDGLLDLILDNEDTALNRKDYYPKPELLFLGPDENVTDDLIEWIIERATERGYSLPNSFMSSKPGAGINHKEYGVTSEGVNVFLRVGLSSLGINPADQSFTIKLTGGPDGDVAGNLIKILHRDYQQNACIIGIADGSGCIEDPKGLDHSELLRLVTEGLMVASYDKNKLSAAGRVLSIHESGGVEARNTLHFRLPSDVFVPAGGRPSTINDSNVAQYIDADGRPASRLIVEGANLFLTGDAREWLTQ